VTSPFAAFNRRYHFLFRWDEDVCPRRDNIQATLADAIGVACAAGRMTDALCRRSVAEQTLIRTIAAGVALHYSGVFSKKLGISEQDFALDGPVADRLMKMFTLVQQGPHLRENVARSLGLRKNEIEAVWSYTQAHKELESFGAGKQNPSYMKKAFGSFASGWEALASALCKLPSFGRLGMTVSTFRTVRDAKEIDSLKALPIGSRLVLGCMPMGGGQRHVTSTAITMSKWTLPSTVMESGGVLCYFGASAVFINWLGQYQMWMDGGESLYPPGTIMQLSAKVRDGYGGKLPVFLLEEIPTFGEADLRSAQYFDDYTFKRIHDPAVITAARKSAQVSSLLDLERFHDGELAQAFFEV
jgi:hypothetical protein